MRQNLNPKETKMRPKDYFFVLSHFFENHLLNVAFDAKNNDMKVSQQKKKKFICFKASISFIYLFTEFCTLS